jgi:hypothetical protein
LFGQGVAQAVFRSAKKNSDQCQHGSQSADRAELALQFGQFASQPSGGFPIAAQVAGSLAPFKTVSQREIDSPAIAAFGANETLALER